MREAKRVKRRGSGLRGLTGIPPKRDGIIRPLLTTTRTEILEYLRVYGLAHVEDSSNASPAFTRNRLRLEVMPLLEDIAPGCAGRIAAAGALLLLGVPLEELGPPPG